MKTKQTSHLDERLADYTDRLMAGETPEKLAIPGSDQTTQRLEETIEKARGVFHAEQPDLALRNRIRARLTAEWHKTGPRVQVEKEEWLSTRKKKQAWLLRFAALSAVLAVIAGLIAPKLDTVLPGASQNKGVAVVVVLVVMAVLAVLLFRSPRKP